MIPTSENEIKGVNLQAGGEAISVRPLVFGAEAST